MATINFPSHIDDTLKLDEMKDISSPTVITTKPVTIIKDNDQQAPDTSSSKIKAKYSSKKQSLEKAVIEFGANTGAYAILFIRPFYLVQLNLTDMAEEVIKGFMER
jgi:hypothetical protein